MWALGVKYGDLAFTAISQAIYCTDLSAAQKRSTYDTYGKQGMSAGKPQENVKIILTVSQHCLRSWRVQNLD